MSKQFRNGACSCWPSVDYRLEKQGGCLDTSLDMEGHVYLNVGTCAVFGKPQRKVPRVVASFCPFCGKPLVAARKSKKGA